MVHSTHSFALVSFVLRFLMVFLMVFFVGIYDLHVLSWCFHSLRTSVCYLYWSMIRRTDTGSCFIWKEAPA
jgi:hypothetical protein